MACRQIGVEVAFAQFANREYCKHMISLRPQDVVVLLKLALHRDTQWTYPSLSASVGISASEVHASVKRSLTCNLMKPEKFRPHETNLLEFLQHGIRYVFVPKRGELTRGIPTAHAAPPLSGLVADAEDFPPVWPYPEGTVRGQAIEPLYPAAIGASLRDPGLYECLALVDALRIGKARERNLAADLLAKRLKP